MTQRHLKARETKLHETLAILDRRAYINRAARGRLNRSWRAPASRKLAILSRAFCCLSTVTAASD